MLSQEIVTEIRPRNAGDAISQQLRQAALGYTSPAEDPVVSRDWADTLYETLKPHIAAVLGGRPPLNPLGGPWKYYLPTVIQRCEWWRFYDVCEEIYHIVRQNYVTELARSFERRLNGILATENVAWEMRQGRVERRWPPFVAERVREVRQLLSDPKFGGPDEQFEKALGFLSQRPEPDEENAVKEAISAVEGVARILSGDHKATLGQIINKHFKSKMPPALFKAFEGVWGFATDAPGARHAKVGNVQMPIAEAELLLTLSAGMISYLAKLGGDNP